MKKDRNRRTIRLRILKEAKKIMKEAIENKSEKLAFKKIDSMVSKGVIKKNKCNRMKSKISCQINACN